MISKRFLGAFLFAASSIPAFAADLPARSAPGVFAPPEPIGAWSGFYIGGNAGYGWGNGGTRFTPLPDPVSFGALQPTKLGPKPDGFLGGGQLGYQFQSGRLFFGGEADFQGSRLRGSARQFTFPFTTELCPRLGQISLPASD